MFFFNWVIKRGKSENRCYKSWKEYVVTWPKGLWMVINFFFVLRVIVADLWLNCWNILKLISLPHLFVPLLWEKQTLKEIMGDYGKCNSRCGERYACWRFINILKGRSVGWVMITIYLQSNRFSISLSNYFKAVIFFLLNWIVFFSCLIFWFFSLHSSIPLLLLKQTQK